MVHIVKHTVHQIPLYMSALLKAEKVVHQFWRRTKTAHASITT